MGFCFLYFFISFFLFLGGEADQNTTTQTIKFKVGVVLDLESVTGKMGLSCMSMALSDFYANHTSYKTRLVLYPRDSNGDVVGAASAAADLLKNVEVQAIVGPVKSSQAVFMAALGKKAQVPIISFSATSPSISSSKSSYFIRTAQNDSSQVHAIASIVKAFGWKAVVLIYEETEYGNGVIPCLIDALQDIDTRVRYRSVISTSATDDKILKELYNLKTMQTRVFILHMSHILGSRLFLKAKDAGMMNEGYSWIITDGLTNFLTSMNSSIIDSMQGVLGVRPYVPWSSDDLAKFRVRWKKNFTRENPDMNHELEVHVLGLWAYDAIWALASAVEKVGITRNSSFLKPKSMESSTSSIFNLGVSHIGPKLLQEISNIDFKGLSGKFRLVDGQLQASTFQIVNVVGKGEREIGLWTPKNGILRRLINRHLSGVDASSNSTSKDHLGSIIWPGDSTHVPKGWVVPTSGKRLRIGVPVKDGFNEFVNVTWDNDTNRTTVTGYCIDVFKAVIETLPYALPYDFIPFVKEGHQSAGTYNELTYQVYLQKFDAVVGDTAILANRSNYVDFTLPYTESGVSMFVPVRDDGRKNGWIFLKPLNWDLCLTSGVFFVFTGFVVWVLEHRINEDFRGPFRHQLGTTFYFAFSTLVFAHKKVVSNLARFVVIIWIFVVLILNSSYTANLTSMLTVQRLEPTIRDIQELIKNKEYVGYQQGSFVLGFLKELKFDVSKLKVYNSPEEFDDALSKGSQKGGIAAAFDEIPCIKLLLAKYCAKYTMVGPIYKTDGFGFVFPRGSPLVPDISRGILNVTEGNTMARIEKFWFGDQKNCPDPTTLVSSNSLTLNSFSGLFLIAAISSTSALLIFSTIFVYDHKHIWSSINPNGSTSFWKRIITLARHFDQKDLSSHAFRKAAGIPYSTRGNIDDMRVLASPDIMNTNPQSTPWSRHSNAEEGNFSPVEDQFLSNANVESSSQEISSIEETMPSV